MDRSIEFEVQYLLSTIIVVIGFIGITNSGDYINEYIGIVFILLTSVHLLLLNTYYSFNQISDVDSSLLGNLKIWSENTLLVVSLAFVFLISHLIVKIPPDFLGDVIEDIPVFGEVIANYLSVIMPLLSTIVVGDKFRTDGLPTFRLSRNLSTNVLPEQVEVYPAYADQQTPLMFEVRNSSPEKYEIEVTMELPDKVVARNVRSDGEFIESEFSESISVRGESRWDMQFEYRHTRTQRETACVDFKVSHDDGQLEESVSLYLR